LFGGYISISSFKVVLVALVAATTVSPDPVLLPVLLSLLLQATQSTSYFCTFAPSWQNGENKTG
jgi:hypothetical protein